MYKVIPIIVCKTISNVEMDKYLSVHSSVDGTREHV